MAEMVDTPLVIFLVQHGEAKPEAEDPDRPLSEKGAAEVRRMAAWAAGAGVSPTRIRHSGKRRAEETATILAERLAPAEGTAAVSGLAPRDDVRPLAEALGDETVPLMLVGHLPHLSRLASLLVAGDPAAAVIRFQNAGIVCLGRDTGAWSVVWAVPPDLVP